MQIPKISIIIPVFNLEKYILKCLESVLAQTYKDYEVIIINDGSTDNSEKIIREFINLNKLDNFFLFEKENSGISDARNFGLNCAKGEWITFVDGDDWIESNYLAAMYDAVDNTSSQLCFAGYRAFDEQTGIFDVWSEYSDDNGVLPHDIIKLYSFGYIWAHIYKNDIIKRHGIVFDKNLNCAEDTAFNLDYNSKIKNFCMVGDVVYNYRVNRNGALTQKLVHPRQKKAMYQHMQNFLASVDEKNIIEGLNCNRRLLRVMWNELYASVTNNILDGDYSIAKKRLKSLISKIVLKKYSPRSKKEKIMRFCLKHSFLLLVILVNVYYKSYEKYRKSKILELLSTPK